MKVGDMVRARHWDNHLVALVLSIRPKTGICKVCLIHSLDYRFDQLIRDMEVICE